MKDTIQKTGNEVSIVIYDAPLPPKYFRLSKRFIKTLFVVFPLLISLLLLGMFLWGLMERLEDAPRPTFPKVLNEQNAKLAALRKEVQDLQASNNVLTEKLASQPASGAAEDVFLLAIKRPYGMQNLMAEKRVTLDALELVKEGNKAVFKFHIISSAEKRVSGHILVFMSSSSGLLAWPPEANNSLSSGIKYTQGDSFAVSRLRPTNAVFPHQLSNEPVKFHIYIFNREGDLLLIQETAPFKWEPKS